MAFRHEKCYIKTLFADIVAVMWI